MKKIIKLIIIILIIILIYFAYKEITKEEILTTEENCFEFSDGIITDYNEVCGSNVHIPDYINGIKVYKIGNFAFKDKNIKSVILPNNIEIIGIGAFQNNNIKSLIIPDSVLEINALSFNNNKIRSLTIGKNVKYIGIKAFNQNDLKTKYAFIYERNEDGINNEVIIGYGGRSKDIKIPDNVKVISYQALIGNDIETINLNEVVRIESYALEEVEKIIIPSNITYIGDGNLFNEVIIEGKTSIEEFDYFDKEYTKKVKFGDLDE